MTRKEIDNLSFADALKIFNEQGRKLNFDTRHEDIKKFARNFLRKQKVYHALIIDLDESDIFKDDIVAIIKRKRDVARIKFYEKGFRS